MPGLRDYRVVVMVPFEVRVNWMKSPEAAIIAATNLVVERTAPVEHANGTGVIPHTLMSVEEIKETKNEEVRSDTQG